MTGMSNEIIRNSLTLVARENGSRKGVEFTLNPWSEELYRVELSKNVASWGEHIKCFEVISKSFFAHEIRKTEFISKFNVFAAIKRATAEDAGSRGVGFRMRIPALVHARLN